MTLKIERMGREGDGLAQVDGRTVPVPFTLPRETVETDPLRVVEPSADRVEPVCRHFGTCGNCALQHWAAEPMLAWKRDQVVAAFRREGLEPNVARTVAVPLHSRRRVAFAFVAGHGDVALAFHERRSHATFRVEECPILVREIETNLIGPQMLARVMVASVEGVTVTACENGLDVQLLAKRQPNDQERRGLIRLLRDHVRGVVRLCVNDEIILASQAPIVRFGDAAVTPPPGAFLQATGESESAMADLAVGHVSGARRTVDLFAGCGTFALRLGGTVHAVDDAGASLDALAKGAAASGRDAVTTERRDLFERPLSPKELERYDAVVLDPPRAGAEAQVRELAKTTITRIAYVSCNPATLARDAKVLVDAGWTCASVTPVDQFLYSPHVEAVALFEREKVRRKRPLFG